MIRTLLWKTVETCAKPLLHRRAVQGCPWTVSESLWKRLTPPRWLTLEHHILSHGEEFARTHLQTHGSLAQVIKDCDVSASSITPFTVLLIWHLVQSRRPLTILDLGSGVSSRLFALYARSCSESGHEPPDIISVDHDKGWLEKTAETLDSYGLTPYVRLVHAPLIEQNIDGQLLLSYSLKPIEEATNQKSVDFLLIDGPPSAIGRGPCLPLFAHLLAQRAVVLLDDFCRDGERAAVQQWEKGFVENIQSIKCALTGRGMAIIEWVNMNRKECANQRNGQYVVS